MRIPAIQTFGNDGIMTQIVKIYSEMILIHIYIPPDIDRNTRKTYWKQIGKFVEMRDKPILLTGDLNTKDRRFGIHHDETHKYLDSILEECKLMNNPERPTRGNNSLDITIANRQMAKEILQWDVHAELGSDHSPTTIDTTIRRKSTQRIPPSRKRIQRIDTRATTKA
ncbi:hypothetical protein B5P41_30070, partial [Bacillus sp. SRB_28]